MDRSQVQANSPGAANLCFLPTITPKARSSKEKQLSYSSARSHVAKLAHRRRNLQSLRTSDIQANSIVSQSTSNAGTTAGDVGLTTKQHPPTLSLLILRDKSRKQTIRIDRRHSAESSSPADGEYIEELCWSIPPTEYQSTYVPVTQDTHQRLDRSSGNSPTLYMPDYWSTVSDMLANTGTQRLMHHCKNVFWPGFEQGKYGFKQPFKTSWSSLMEHGPALFHEVLWQAAVNISCQTGLPITDPDSLAHYHKAVQCLSKTVILPIDSIDEPTMFAMLGLASCPYNGALVEGRGGFSPPFPGLQWLNVYGRQPLVNIHAAALYHLVHLKGGIDCLMMEGFAGSLNYVDLLKSTFTLERPHFAIARYTRDLAPSHNRKTFFGHAPDFRMTQPSYDHDLSDTAIILELVQYGLDDELREVMLDLRVWLQVLARYADNTISEPDFSFVAAHRNLLHHRLMSTIPEGGIELSLPKMRSEPTPDVNTLVRLGLLIFAIGVTFPMTNRRLFRVLGVRLKKQLLMDLCVLLDLQMGQVVTWLCLLGSLAAVQISDDTLRADFVTMMVQVEGVIVEVRSWMTVKQSCLEKLVWYGSACDAAAQKVWEDVQCLSQMNAKS